MPPAEPGGSRSHGHAHAGVAYRSAVGGMQHLRQAMPPPGTTPVLGKVEQAVCIRTDKGAAPDFASKTCVPHLACFAAGSVPESPLLAARRAATTFFVQVVHTPAMGVPADFLLCDDAIIGARYTDEEYEDQAVFTVFALLQAGRFLQPLPRRVLVLGLGAGAVNEAFVGAGMVVDTVELVPEIVQAAEKFFAFQQAPHGGQTYVSDALEVVFAEPTHRNGYDLVVHDLYSGANPSTLLSQRLFRRLQDAWLSDFGVLWVNFIGYDSPERGSKSKAAYPLTLAIVSTLQSVFRQVHCYSEVPPGFANDSCTNIVCMASQKPWHLAIPKDGDYWNPIHLSVFYIVKHFQEWELSATALGAGESLPVETAGVIQEDGSVDRFAEANRILEVQMQSLVRGILPAEALHSPDPGQVPQPAPRDDL